MPQKETPLPEFVQARLRSIQRHQEFMFREQELLYKEATEMAAKLLGCSPDEISVSFVGCTGPIGICAYENETDPCQDECLFCGDPRERK